MALSDQETASINTPINESKLHIFKFDNGRLPSLRYIDGDGHRIKDLAVVAHSHGDASKILTEQFKKEDK
jgi:hypothetical protein